MRNKIDMGNQDMIVVVNGVAFLVEGLEYNTSPISKGIEKYEFYMASMLKSARVEEPDDDDLHASIEIEANITSVKTFPFIKTHF